MRLPYWTKSAGSGGAVLGPDDFVVKELLHRKYFAKYSTSGKVSRRTGKYNLFLLRKRGMTTHSALEIIRKKFAPRRIGFAGLKDKKAVTEQYITMEGGHDFSEENIELTEAGTTDRMLSKGDLVGNQFSITLHGCNTKRLEQAVKEINRKGFPNYFGPQRFGMHRNNHVIGRLIVKRKFGKALDLINRSGRKKYSSISAVPKQLLKFLVNAYQSWIFNKALAGYVLRRKKTSSIEITGFNSRTADKEGIRPSDFMITELRLACAGSKRRAFIKASVEYKITGSDAILDFTLPPGSYATVLLGELTK